MLAQASRADRSPGRHHRWGDAWGDARLGATLSLVWGGRGGDACAVRPTALARSLLTAAIFAVVLACNPISDLPRGDTARGRGPISDWPTNRPGVTGAVTEEEADDSSEPETLEPATQSEREQSEPASPTMIETPPLSAAASLDAGTTAAPNADSPPQADADTADAGDDAGGDAGAVEASVEAAL
jgi:hypothetical protein